LSLFVKLIKRKKQTNFLGGPATKSISSMKYKVTIILFCLVTNFSISQVRLPRLVGDSMVLQRDRKINIWGWASAGEKVSVRFDNKTFKTTTNGDGKWILQLPSMKAGGPYTMEITGQNKITLHGILIGDVWFCSGQSNMVHQMQLHSVRYADEIAHANYPEIRHFLVPTLTDLQSAHDNLTTGSWKSANPDNVLAFSAVAYFFGKDLYEKYHVPIGLINSSVGGTPIEAWISEEGLKSFPSISNTIGKNKDTAYINSISKRNSNTDANMPKQEDKGLTGTVSWYDPAYVPKEWRQIGIPGYWEDQGIKDLDGIVWYRKEIDVPASMTGKPAKVFLGRIVDADFLYINGAPVGNTAYQYPQRRYAIPPGVLKPGKNLFVVRVINNSGKGGFVPDKPYCLIAGNDTIDLKGYWQYKVGEVFGPQDRAGGPGFLAQYQPTALYNTMVAPLINYTIKGILWYQGEANTTRAAEYAKLQPAMIADWRGKWKEGDIPFLYVQLPGFMDYNYLPSESQWAELREAQLQSLSVPNTAMAVAIDLGEWNDIHPDRKKEVGDRLALAAEKIAYGQNIVYSGPFYQSSTIDSNKIVISFNNTGSGLIFKDSSYISPSPGEVEGAFAIAGTDRKFVWAKAKIEGDKVIVWSDEITAPKYVRYAWADDPVNPNLYNKEGLPASPFRTDAPNLPK
jgi:sialate O-acetylesterase